MMGTMSKGSEHWAQLALTEHSSSGLVWETRSHTNAHEHTHTRPLKEAGTGPHASVE